MTERRLKGKVALITGAGSGVGRATAILFAKEGARVVAAGRTLAKCEETARLVESAGGQCHPIHCDVSNSEDVQIMIAVEFLCQVEPGRDRSESVGESEYTGPMRCRRCDRDTPMLILSQHGESTNQSEEKYTGLFWELIECPACAVVRQY